MTTINRDATTATICHAHDGVPSFVSGFSVDVGANEYELKAKQIHVNITLNPTRVVEQISLNFFIK